MKPSFTVVSLEQVRVKVETLPRREGGVVGGGGVGRQGNCNATIH